VHLSLAGSLQTWLSDQSDILPVAMLLLLLLLGCGSFPPVAVGQDAYSRMSAQAIFTTAEVSS
jgi:hypothetical protein